MVKGSCYFVFGVSKKDFFCEVVFWCQCTIWVWSSVFKVVDLPGDQTLVISVKGNWNILEMEVGPFLY